MAGLYCENPALPTNTFHPTPSRAETASTGGHLLECPVIRVDCFTSPTPTKPRHLPHPTDPKAPRQPAPNAQLYLLTHVHTDHLVGLTQDFTGQIICSHDTKRLLPRLEAETDRINYHNGHREVLRTKYEALGPQMRFGPSNGKRVVVDRIVSPLARWRCFKPDRVCRRDVHMANRKTTKCSVTAKRSRSRSPSWTPTIARVRLCGYLTVIPRS